MIDDKGPWTVRRDDDRKWRICSENFTHDVELIVTGEFKDDTEVVEYAAMLARKLSGAPLDGSLTPRPEAGETTYKRWDRVLVAWQSGHLEECTVEDTVVWVKDYTGHGHEVSLGQISKITESPARSAERTVSACEYCWARSRAFGVEYQETLAIAEREKFPCTQDTIEGKRLRAGQWWDEANQRDTRDAASCEQGEKK